MVTTPAEYCAQHAIVVTRPGQQGDERTPSDEWEPVQTFDDAPFSPKLVLLLKAAGFASPSPIQAQCWPIANAGHDIVAVAKTGSGKTLSFLLPTFARALDPATVRPRNGDSPFAIVLAPTRELVCQIYEQAVEFGGQAGVTSMCIYGGASRAEQLPGLKAGPMLVVATPGRLVDFMTEKPIGIKVEGSQVLILDEADRMLDMGFAPSLLAVANRLSHTRQTLMFSATWPKKVQELAANLQSREGAVHVMLGGTEKVLSANSSITQHIYECTSHSEAHHAVRRRFPLMPSPCKTVCLPLKYSSNPGGKRRISQGCHLETPGNPGAARTAGSDPGRHQSDRHRLRQSKGAPLPRLTLYGYSQ
jgi:ATP-dependent RNA helicase DDX5/DBP2